MRKIQKSRTGLAYSRSGGGRPLLLLHSIPGSGASWHKVVSSLGADFEVIVPDLLGFGASDRPSALASLHAASQAEALSVLLDELGLESVAVAGHDFGGPVALLLCSRRPEKVSHLALFATNAFTDTPIPFPLSIVTWPVLGEFAASILFSRASLRIMLRVGTGASRTRLDPAAYLGDRSQVQSIRTVFAGSLTRLQQLYAPIQAQIAEISIPCLVGWGDRDPFFSVKQGERTAAALGTPLKVYQTAGHFLPEEQPVEIAADLRALILRDSELLVHMRIKDRLPQAIPTAH